MTASAHAADDSIRLPLVSVIITNHNYAAYIPRAISSVAQQGYPRLECVVVDDCSTDGSFDVITAQLAQLYDTRFRALRLDKNMGQLGAMKAGLAITTGPFVHFLDADDFVFPHFLERHIEAHLNSSYSAGVTASDTMQIDGDGQILETTFHTLLKRRSDAADANVKLVIPEAISKIAGDAVALGEHTGELLYAERDYVGWPVVATSSMMFRRDAIDFVMPDNTEEVRICADYYLAQYIHYLTGTLTIGSTLSCFRLHRKNYFSKNAVLGGPYPPGFLNPEMREQIDRVITRHVIDNIERVQQVIGLGGCLRLIEQSFHAGQLHDAVSHVPTLRLVLGHGSEQRFYIKYRTLARLHARWPRGFGWLLAAKSRGRRIMARLSGASS